MHQAQFYKDGQTIKTGKMKTPGIIALKKLNTILICVASARVDPKTNKGTADAFTRLITNTMNTISCNYMEDNLSNTIGVIMTMAIFKAEFNVIQSQEFYLTGTGCEK